jgi:hypothetical protein
MWEEVAIFQSIRVEELLLSGWLCTVYRLKKGIGKGGSWAMTSVELDGI